MSEYRDSGFYTLDELRSETAKAAEALNAAKAARIASARAAMREETRCKTAGWCTLGGFFATSLAGAYRIQTALVCLLCAATTAAAVAAVVFLVRFARAELKFRRDAQSRSAAFSVWHRAFSRECCEESRLEHGYNGRCACEECDADPLGFFGPFRASGES